MVGHRPLEAGILVRIQVPEPKSSAIIILNVYIRSWDKVYGYHRSCLSMKKWYSKIQ